jgi:hypothetical protein
VSGARIKVNSFDPYPILAEGNAPIAAGRIKAGKSYVVRYSGKYFYFMGEYQICAVSKLVSREPSSNQVQYDLANEPTTNISYVVEPETPFGCDIIGEIRQVLAGADYDAIYSEGLAAQRAEYENWKKSDLLDTIQLEMVSVPWLDVNQKIEYRSFVSGETGTYLVKSVSGSAAQGTMSVTCVRFQPLYPWLM